MPIAGQWVTSILDGKMKSPNHLRSAGTCPKLSSQWKPCSPAASLKLNWCSEQHQEISIGQTGGPTLQRGQVLRFHGSTLCGQRLPISFTPTRG